MSNTAKMKFNIKHMPVIDSIKNKSFNHITQKKYIGTTTGNKNDIIVILRGHIRNSFNNEHLYNYLSNLNKKYNLYIFIHTWNIKNNSLSWRHSVENTSVVTKELIMKYFKNLKIEKLMIDDDKKIQLIGETEGLIKTTLMPIKGWKNMWYGIHKIAQYILLNMHRYKFDSNTFTLNMRFDYFTNSTLNQYVSRVDNYNFVNKLLDSSSDKINFLKNPPNHYGIDNIYTGKFYKIYYTILLFHFKLDEIICCYDMIHAQEKLVLLVQEYIDKYCDHIIDDVDYVTSTINFIIWKLSKKGCL